MSIYNPVLVRGGGLTDEDDIFVFFAQLGVLDLRDCSECQYVNLARKSVGSSPYLARTMPVE